MATMDDIAKKLGISKSTVSKAFSGAGDVSEAMRRAVLETAVELGYSRIPRSWETPHICVFIENMSYEHPSDFGWDLVTGFRKLAEPDGYDVQIVPLDTDMQRQMPYDEYMLLHNYKGGFFLGSALSDPWMQDFRTCRTPTVLLDNQPQYNPNVSHVGIDNEEGMEMAIRELLKLGHKKIGYLGGGLGAYIFQERYRAFFRALRKNKMDDTITLAGHSFFTSEILEQHLPNLISQGCTAILCSHDLLARDVMEHCAGIGVRVPDDLSIVGLDDLPICTTMSPTLSTIRQDRTELGKSAYYALTSQMGGIHINTVKLHPEVILRNSVGRAPEESM